MTILEYYVFHFSNHSWTDNPSINKFESLERCAMYFIWHMALENLHDSFYKWCLTTLSLAKSWKLEIERMKY